MMMANRRSCCQNVVPIQWGACSTRSQKAKEVTWRVRINMYYLSKACFDRIRRRFLSIILLLATIAANSLHFPSSHDAWMDMDMIDGGFTRFCSQNIHRHTMHVRNKRSTYMQTLLCMHAGWTQRKKLVNWTWCLYGRLLIPRRLPYCILLTHFEIMLEWWWVIQSISILQNRQQIEYALWMILIYTLQVRTPLISAIDVDMMISSSLASDLADPKRWRVWSDS